MDIDIPDEYCGRTINEIRVLAQDLKDVALKGDRYGNKFELSDMEASEYILIRVLDQTFEGYLNELEVANDIGKLIPLGCAVIPSTGKDDKDGGVDLYVVKDQTLLCGIQVKPMSFFAGFNRDYIRKARIEHDQKHLNFTKQYGVKVFYIVKDRDSTLYNVESRPNINLKEKLENNLDCLLQEIKIRI